MAKSVGLIFALCFFVAVVHGRHLQQVFNVEGDVYCDPCRVEFITELSTKLHGATVELECRNIETKDFTYSVSGTTDADGHYSLKVIGDHQDDTCEVSVVESPLANCSVPMGEFEKSRIECTENSGLHAAVRYANPIGFMTKDPLPTCAAMLFDMGIILQ